MVFEFPIGILGSTVNANAGSATEGPNQSSHLPGQAYLLVDTQLIYRKCLLMEFGYTRKPLSYNPIWLEW